VVTEAGDLVALDAKMGFDDNALFRHPTSALSAIRTRRIRARSRRRSSTFRTSASRATSAAW
jgi:succinyl-CoA synthetase beta subunit